MLSPVICLVIHICIDIEIKLIPEYFKKYFNN